MLARFSRQAPPPQSPSLTALPTRQPLSVPSVTVTPGTPQLTLSSAHNPYGGLAGEGGDFSTVTLSAFDDDDDDDEKSSIPTEKEQGAAVDPAAIPPSRRFLHPQDHPRLSALLASADSDDNAASVKRRRFVVLKIVFLLCVVALTVGLGVGLGNKSGGNKASSATARGGAPPAPAVDLATATRSSRSVVSTALLTAPGVREEKKAEIATPTRWSGVGQNGGIKLSAQPAALLAHKKAERRRMKRVVR
ncbi:hypothetical protein JCM6882_000351 [Rhodosporidiobolus microsporus]